MTARAVGTALGLVVALLVGLVIGFAGAFVSSQHATIGVAGNTLSIPWGVPLVWGALLCAIRGGTWLVQSRTGGWLVAVGWLASTVLMATESPSGDLAIPGGARSMTYLVGGVILATAAAMLPLPRSVRPRTAAGPAPEATS